MRLEVFAMAEQEKHTKQTILLICVIISVLAVSGCTHPAEKGEPAPTPPDGRAYTESANIDCIDCHAVQYQPIENGSGGHARLNCTFCHIQHGYRPDCGTCHPDPHGEGISGCTICHPDPHAPETRIKSTRNNSVCLPCHIPQYDDIEEGSGRHSILKCDLCHVQHGYLPICSDCHGMPHGPDVSGCEGCHNPHAPESIEFDTHNNSECARCHRSVVRRTFVAVPTRHADLACDMCHPRHAATMLCIDCHPGHSTEMNMRDCCNCHRTGHVPTSIQYSSNPATTKSGVCVDCHAKPFNTMLESESEHQYIECVRCHPEHGSAATLACASCHTMDPSHGTNCVACHGPAHDLATSRG